MSLLCPNIIIPTQKGVIETIQIIVKPNSDTVTVVHLFPYDERKKDRFPTHFALDVFEAPVDADKLARAMQEATISTIKADDQRECIVHLHNVVDGKPIVCQSLASAIMVAKSVADRSPFKNRYTYGL